MELTESAAERDKDATPIFSARGTQYRFQSDGKTLSLQSRAAGSDTWGKPVPVTAPKTNTTASAIAHPDGSEKQEQEAIRKEIQGIIRINKKQRVIFPGASDASTWPHMLDRGAAYQYLENLRKTKPEVYEDYKRRLEATEGQ
jgi:hypothetical protein